VRIQAVAVPSGFDPAPSVALITAVEVTAAAAVPDDADAVGVLVGTDGSVPEHLDIAGVADVEKPGGWRTRGCSGFGARMLADFAVGFRS
jgi:hypothetical protein